MVSATTPRRVRRDPVLTGLHRLEVLVNAAHNAGTITPAAAEHANTLCATTRRVLPRLDSLGEARGSTHAIIASAIDFAGTCLAQYLRLPADYAMHRPLGDDGVTSCDILTTQLATLVRYVATVDEAISSADANRLLDLGGLLTKRFSIGFEPNAIGSEPAADEPAADEPAADEPAADEPAAGEGADPAPPRELTLREKDRRANAAILAATAVVTTLALAIGIGATACSGPDTPTSPASVEQRNHIGDPQDSASPTPGGAP